MKKRKGKGIARLYIVALLLVTCTALTAMFSSKQGDESTRVFNQPSSAPESSEAMVPDTFLGDVDGGDGDDTADIQERDALSQDFDGDSGNLTKGDDVYGDAPLPGQQQTRLPSMPQSGNPSLPLNLPLQQMPVLYTRGTALESWQFTSSVSCADYARMTLLSLQASGARLIEAGYLDLIGECWGCVIQDNLSRSFNITLMPQEVFKSRSDANQLLVTVIHYLEPLGV
ncbi:MAG: hypothetical protein LBU07_05630 [Coriobacteriales bacterium]|jgi:hypothetical protein|nr:hypothetical protein [Coriobacteriales bacterium]